MKKKSDVVVPSNSQSLTMRNKLALITPTESFEKLQKFEEVSRNYKNKNFFGKFFSQSELKEAQLDAIEGMTEISKFTCKIVQALAVSDDIQMEQQEQIKQEQEELKKQGKKLEEMTEALLASDDQMKKLMVELEKNVQDMIYIKGLTSEEAKKLIGVRKSVENVENKIREENMKMSDNLEAKISAAMATRMKTNFSLFTMFTALNLGIVLIFKYLL